MPDPNDTSLYIFKSGQGLKYELNKNLNTNRSFSATSNNITTNVTGSNLWTGVVKTTTNIDISNYNKLICDLGVTKVEEYPIGNCIGISTSNSVDISGDDNLYNSWNAKNDIPQAIGTYKIELDISNYQGMYYVGMSLGNASMTITNIRLT